MYKLLIVDDDSYCREVLSDALETDEFEIHTADDGEAALEAVRLIAPDLILLDIAMPKMDGIEVLKRLKSADETRRIPVIMVTAMNGDSQVATCLDNGAVDHVVKPFSNVVVRARVHAALRSYDAITSSSNWEPKSGKIFAFIGAKGGIGTTTTALNVALDLVKQGKSTIVCELRPDFGTAAVQLGISPARDLRTLLEHKSDRVTNDELEICLSKHQTGLRTLLAPQECDDLVDITSEQAKDIVSTMADIAEYVIVDLPCSPSLSTDVVLQRADFVVLTVELETASLAAANWIIKRLHNLGIGSNGVGVVVTNRASVSSPISLSEVRSTLDCLLIGVVPADPDSCMYASKNGSPVVCSMPESRAAEAFACLSNRLSGEQVAVMEF
jgi:DNA-binding response OmpR family regulator